MSNSEKSEIYDHILLAQNHIKMAIHKINDKAPDRWAEASKLLSIKSSIKKVKKEFTR